MERSGPGGTGSEAGEIRLLFSLEEASKSFREGKKILTAKGENSIGFDQPA